MDLLRFLSDRNRTTLRHVVGLIVLSGLASGLLLGVVNAAAEMAANSAVQVRFFLLFGAVLAVFVITKRRALAKAAIAAEVAVRDIRVDLSDKIRRAELLQLETIGKSDIYARLTQDTSIISQSMPVLFNGYQSAVVVLAGLLYMAWISLDAFVLTAGLLAFGAWAHIRQGRRTMADLIEATGKETEFFDSLGHLVDGFKELKINHPKNDAVFQRVQSVSVQTEQLMSRSAVGYINHLVVIQTLIYLVIATLVFVLPNYNFLEPSTVLKLTASILFMVGPLEIVSYAYHVQTKAKVALASVRHLQASLDAALDRQDSGDAPDQQRFAGFRRIDLRNVVFSYPGDDHSFQVGPISLTIERGTTTFLVGGNGCGKSTLLKLLTGLYHPQSGRLIVDGVDVAPAAYPSYRALFAAVFADFHLFDRLYGLDGVDPAEVGALIERMGLAGKTGYRDGRFTNLDLSTGQRKRLALAAAMLEDKAVYIFDEWAADQDPEFRLHFYTAILPELKAAGKTVIAVTHDDRYFDRCDQLVKLEYGELAAELHPAG
jgi:putative ATP-binding cassette transporter